MIGPQDNLTTMYICDNIWYHQKGGQDIHIHSFGKKMSKTEEIIVKEIPAPAAQTQPKKNVFER